MLVVMKEHAYILGSISSPQCTLAVSSITLPHTNVALSCLQKSGAFAMTHASHPPSLVKIAIVVIASTVAVTFVVAPLASILVAS